MKLNYKVLMLAIVAIIGFSLDARRGGGYHGGGRGYHGGGYRRGGYYHRGGYYGRPYYRRPWGYGPYGGVGFSISSAPSSVVYDCSYAQPGAPYYQYKRQVTDPINDQNGYYAWLRNTYPNWQDYWNQFQAYLNYRSCKKEASKPQVGFSFGVGGGRYW